MDMWVILLWTVVSQIEGTYIYTLYPHRHCNYNDIESHASRTVEECQQICNADDTCVGLVYWVGGSCNRKSVCDVNSLGESEERNLYIKQWVSEPTTTIELSTTHEVTTTLEPTPAIELYTNYATEIPQIARCAMLCNGKMDQKCRSFVYDPATSGCEYTWSRLPNVSHDLSGQMICTRSQLAWNCVYV